MTEYILQVDSTGTKIEELDKLFNGKITLPKVYKMKTITAIGESACYNGSLTELDISNTNIEIIYEDAFFNCTFLTKIIFPETIKSLYFNAFFNVGIESLDLPFSLIDFDGSAFNQCPFLTNIQIKQNSQFESIENVIFSKEKKIIVVPRNFTSYSQIPNFDQITGIGQCAFTCTNITSIVAPESLEILDKYAFHMMKKCVIVDLSKSKINSIPQHAFRYNYAYKIILPPTVTELNSQSFIKCYSSVIILKFPLITIKESVFEDCYNLSKIFYFGITDFSSTEMFTGETNKLNIHVYVTLDYPSNSFGGVPVSRYWLFRSCFHHKNSNISFILLLLLTIII